MHPPSGVHGGEARGVWLRTTVFILRRWTCAGYKGSSDLFIDSNAQLALTGAKQVGCSAQG
jgi:hypothetical protein